MSLHDLGLDLATVRKVLDREASVAEVAEVHANALDVQIQTLRLCRAVLRAVARRGPTTLETDLMHRLTAAKDQAQEPSEQDVSALHDALDRAMRE
ncbi:hypothetical protein [Streptomyces graminilatus]|uniref:hypothetical protein n=1 Tax=Streptomyces graminilatus TaxID=1464070 RepID=UPI0006E37847